jgi:hypothetical protein
MSVRWTDEDLTKFRANSGRGLPKPTLQHMANATGQAVDCDGQPVPATPAELGAREKVKETKRRMEPPKKSKGNKLRDAVARSINDNKFLHNLDTQAAALRVGKYKNTKRVRDGIQFDSILEADYYCQLELERKAKVISYYLRQVPLHLPGGVKLVVDFVVFLLVKPYEAEPWWRVRYIDTKGFQTPESKNKIKMAEHLYGIKIQLVKKVRKLRS